MAAVAERPVAHRAAYSARPTVLVDGQRQDSIAQMLRACVLREAEGGLASLSMTLSNWGSSPRGIGYLFDDGRLIDFGTQLKLYFGDTSAPRALFEGTVHAVEFLAPPGAPAEICFLAEDRLFAARQARRSALYEQQTPADVVRRVAERLGLRPDVGDLGGEAGTWAQLNESDLAFLRRLLSRFDADLQCSGELLQVRRSAEGERGTIDLTIGGQLQQLRVVADLADQVTQVTASGFDAVAGRSFNARSSGAMPGTGSGQNGRTLLQQKVGERSEHLAPLACRNEAEARALADAAFDQRARRFVRAHGSTEGNAELRVGTVLQLSGLGPRFSNRYAVVEATHRYDQLSGYQTDFVAQSAWLGQA